MYTLRIFKHNSDERTQVYLGDSYIVKQPSKEDADIGIKLRVYGNWDSTTKEGLAVWHEDNAFVMTALGLTFETLNRPKNIKGQLREVVEKEEYFVNKVEAMCEESLDPERFEKWEDVKAALQRNRQALKTSG